MWELDRHLQKDEKIVYEGKPVWFGYILWLILAIITIYSILLPILIISYVFLSMTSTRYALTNKRIIARYGIISEDFKSSSFKHITSVRVTQSFIGRIFGFGDIIIDTSGSGSGREFIWRYVQKPVDVKNNIEQYID